MRTDVSPYEIGQWGEENYVGTYTDEHAPEKPDLENKGQAADGGWSAEADGDDLGENESEEGWSAEADGAAVDETASDASITDLNAGEESGDRKEVEPLGDHAMHYLDLIRQLCEEKNIRLLLVKAPSVSPVWYAKWEEQITAYAKRYSLDYINYLELVDEIGIDFSKDTYDEGLHMNYSGAVKCADYLGRYLSERYKLEDKRTDPLASEKWQKRKETQSAIYKIQQRELEENGKVISF